MICPKCAKASLVEIVVKATGKNAYMCDHCDTVWFVGELLTTHSGTPFEQVTRRFTFANEKKFLNG